MPIETLLTPAARPGRAGACRLAATLNPPACACRAMMCPTCPLTMTTTRNSSRPSPSIVVPAVDGHEAAVLRATFNDLAKRVPGGAAAAAAAVLGGGAAGGSVGAAGVDASAPPASGVDKTTFFNVFPLPGLLAERVFYLFDSAKTVRPAIIIHHDDAA